MFGALSMLSAPGKPAESQAETPPHEATEVALEPEAAPPEASGDVGGARSAAEAVGDVAAGEAAGAVVEAAAKGDAELQGKAPEVSACGAAPAGKEAEPPDAAEEEAAEKEEGEEGEEEEPPAAEAEEPATTEAAAGGAGGDPARIVAAAEPPPVVIEAPSAPGVPIPKVGAPPQDEALEMVRKLTEQVDATAQMCRLLAADVKSLKAARESKDVPDVSAELGASASMRAAVEEMKADLRQATQEHAARVENTAELVSSGISEALSAHASVEIARHVRTAVEESVDAGLQSDAIARALAEHAEAIESRVVGRVSEELTAKVSDVSGLCDQVQRGLAALEEQAVHTFAASRDSAEAAFADREFKENRSGAGYAKIFASEA